MNNIALQLHEIFNSQRRFDFPFNAFKNDMPKNGVYLIFENGEQYQGLDRIVRVGTHTGNNQLHSRLTQHFLKENKNRSIFRKNIGRCILNIEKSPYLKFWELDTTSVAERTKNLKLIDLDFERQIEKRISGYVQYNLSFCLFQVDTKDDRLFWESRIVSTLAKEKSIKPSEKWLGNFSPKDKIKASGLWQVNELYNESLTESELERLNELVSTQKN
jgi:hypothetical protein